MDISFELYRYFYEVAKAGNVTKASEKLFVSQSAVSQAIKRLETKLGYRLFNRNARGVQLTAEGEVLCAYVSDAITLIENAQEKLSVMRGLRSGEIKIGASDTACSLFLLPYLEKFNAAHPEIHISVINRTTQELIKLLKNGSVDISFVNLPVADDEMLEITPVMQIHDCFVVGAKYAYLAESAIRLADLCKYPILMLDSSSNSRKHIEAFLASHEIEIKPSIELESLSLLSEFAKIGLGIAATIKEDAQKMIDCHELHELRFPETFPTRNIGLAQVRNVNLSFAAEFFKKSVLTES